MPLPLTYRYCSSPLQEIQQIEFRIFREEVDDQPTNRKIDNNSLELHKSYLSAASREDAMLHSTTDTKLVKASVLLTVQRTLMIQCFWQHNELVKASTSTVSRLKVNMLSLPGEVCNESHTRAILMDPSYLRLSPAVNCSNLLTNLNNYRQHKWGTK